MLAHSLFGQSPGGLAMYVAMMKAREEEGGYGGHQERSLARIAYLESVVPPLAETGHLDNADLVVIAFGYVARFVKYAVKLLRDEGLRVGFVRPVSYTHLTLPTSDLV